MNDLLPFIISGVFALGVSLVGGFFLIRNGRRQSQTPVPPTWPEILAKFESQDRKIGALSRLLASAAEQWPPGAPGPMFDEHDLTIVDEDTMPVNWRRKNRRGPRAATQS